jgi:hypothetical protein
MIMAGVGDKRVQQKRFLNYLAAAKSNEDLWNCWNHHPSHSSVVFRTFSIMNQEETLLYLVLATASSHTYRGFQLQKTIQDHHLWNTTIYFATIYNGEKKSSKETTLSPSYVLISSYFGWNSTYVFTSGEFEIFMFINHIGFKK